MIEFTIFEDINIISVNNLKDIKRLMKLGSAN